MGLSSFEEPEQPEGTAGATEDNAKMWAQSMKLCDNIADAITEYLRFTESMDGNEILRDWVIITGRSVPFESGDSIGVLVAPATSSYAVTGLLTQAMELTDTDRYMPYLVGDDED